MVLCHQIDRRMVRNPVAEMGVEGMCTGRALVGVGDWVGAGVGVGAGVPGLLASTSPSQGEKNMAESPVTIWIVVTCLYKNPTINISFRAMITFIIRMIYLYRYKLRCRRDIVYRYISSA